MLPFFLVMTPTRQWEPSILGPSTLLPARQSRRLCRPTISPSSNKLPLSQSTITVPQRPSQRGSPRRNPKLLLGPAKKVELCWRQSWHAAFAGKTSPQGTNSSSTSKTAAMPFLNLEGLSHLGRKVARARNLENLDSSSLFPLLFS